MGKQKPAIRFANLRDMLGDNELPDTPPDTDRMTALKRLFLQAKQLSWGEREFEDMQREAEEKIRELQRRAAHGQKFKDGPKKPRQDKLSKEIEKTYLPLKRQKGKEPTAKEVQSALPVGPTEVVQEIHEDGDIEWTANSGKPKYTHYKTFQNRLTTIREKNRS